MSKKRTEIYPIRAERVKTIRTREKLTQEEFAKATGQVQQNINRIEKMHQGLTEENATVIIEKFPEYRIQWLLGYDDIMTHTDELRGIIHNRTDTAEAINQVIRLIADDICSREHIKRPAIPSIPDFFTLQTMLHDYAELIIYDYLKNRENSRTWKRIDIKANEEGNQNEESKR